MARAKATLAVETELLVRSRRWCALCFGLSFLRGPRKGQIAHVDRDSSNSEFGNLCWLCFEHHDEYDSQTSQSKRFTPAELRRHRDDLYQFLDTQRVQLVAPAYISLSPEAVVLAELLNSRSRSGRKLDSQIRIDALPEAVALHAEDIELAIDELAAGGLIEVTGSGETIFATNRLFWETDPLFRETDPASDAAEVARALVAQSGDAISLVDLASLLGWDARRLNPPPLTCASQV